MGPTLNQQFVLYLILCCSIFLMRGRTTTIMENRIVFIYIESCVPTVVIIVKDKI